MKISNFKFKGMTGTSALDKVFYATIDVQTGMLWWKKTQQMEIQRKFGDFWFFVETGEYTPGLTVHELARSYTAKSGIET